MTMTLALCLLRSGSADYAAFVEALAAERLPTDDLGTGGRFFMLEDGPGAVAFGGLEGTGPDQMFRSVVVLPDRRGEGHGRAITRHLMQQAMADGAERLWLLTRSSASFYGELG